MAWITLNEAINDLTPQQEKGKIAGESIISGEEVYPLIANTIAKINKEKSIICIDGYLAVDFDKFVGNLKEHLPNCSVEYINIAKAYKTSSEIEGLISYCLTEGSDFGYVFKGKIEDFFNENKLCDIISQFESSSANIIICYGIGSGLEILLKHYDLKYYLDITRETLVNRFKQEKLLPFCADANSLSAKLINNRLFYVDYPILNNHKKGILREIDGYIDSNCKERSKYLSNKLYNQLLLNLTEIPFRLKPVYKSGVWGGQRIRKIRGIPDSVVNISFSLELIPSSQAIRILFGKEEIEIPFYNLCWNQPEKLMGEKAVKKFGDHFPLTANYDDTYQGGSLAIQNHPHEDYIKENYNEKMRRDESYYIVEAYPGAKTYHGLSEDADLGEFRRKSELAEKESIPYDYEEYVNFWESAPGDLLLIPSGTVHASGANQLVLEIDTAPSLSGKEYTFHIYDYLRLDMDGSLRGIHIEDFFNVLETSRRRSWVEKRLKQKPRLIRQGDDWAEYLIGEYELMDYKIHRLEFESQISDDTIDRFHVLTLVAGEEVKIKAVNHPEVDCVLRYTETVLIPANTGEYKITNSGKELCKMTKALIK